MSIGNPPQNVTVLVDTGSSELWVNPDCSTANPGTGQQCKQFGQYNPKKSNTPPQGPAGSKTIQYGDPTDQQTQTYAKISYYRDTIALGGGAVKNQTFGIVTQSEGQSQGILGLAPSLQGAFGSDQPYTLVLSNMADQGVINSRVFSLDLRHSDSDYGAVIYGGLDTNKFIGTLEKRPIINGLSGEPRLAAALSSVGLTTTQTRSFNVTGNDSTVLLDSGTTISRMHASVVQPIADALGAQTDESGYYLVPCSLQTAGGSIDFGFGNKVVRVPMKDFVLADSGNTCVLGVVATEDLQILGDSVLRAGYFVFDWDNKQVHIAQAANCGDTNIVAVSSGPDAVPSVTGKCSPSDAAFTGGPVGIDLCGKHKLEC